MTELTREEWGDVAEILGEIAEGFEVTAGRLKEIGDKIPDDSSYEKESYQASIARMTKKLKALRNAAAAILWVSENAANKIRFKMLDSHPPDET